MIATNLYKQSILNMARSFDLQYFPLLFIETDWETWSGLLANMLFKSEVGNTVGSPWHDIALWPLFFCFFLLQVHLFTQLFTASSLALRWHTWLKIHSWQPCCLFLFFTAKSMMWDHANVTKLQLSWVMPHYQNSLWKNSFNC